MNETAPPTSPTLMRLVRRALQVVVWTLGAGVVALAVVWAALQGWIVPRIDDWRPQLERYASRTLGVTVRIGRIEAQRGAWVPSFTIDDVALLDAQGEPALRLARVLATLTPQGLLRGHFDQLVLDGPELTVRRTPDGRWRIGDWMLNAGGGSDAAADWFFSLPEFVIRGATLHYADERLGAEPLTLSAVDFLMRNGPRSHALRLDATPPEGWGSRWSLRGQFRRGLLDRHAGRLQGWSGQIYGDFGHLRLEPAQALLASLGAGHWKSGEGSARVWIDVTHGDAVGATADLALERVSLTLQPELRPLELDALSGRVGARRLAGGFEVYTKGLQFEAGDGRRWPGGDLYAMHTAAEGRLPAVGEVRGERIDLEALARIADSLPLDADARAALEIYAPRGFIERVQARWEGSLAEPSRYDVSLRGRGLGLACNRPVGAGETSAHTASESGAPVAALCFSGLDLELDANARGGSVRVHSDTTATLTLPRVFEEPELGLDRIDARARWTLKGSTLEVPRFDIDWANADLEGRVGGSWAAPSGGAHGPGTLDLSGTVARANGARVYRYLPLHLPQQVRHYVRDAIRQAELRDVSVRVRGDLRRLPYADGKSGEFRFSGKLRDATFAFVPAPEGGPAAANGLAPWPVLEKLSGDLTFERNGMRLTSARSGVQGAPGLELGDLQARLPDFSHDPTVEVSFAIQGPGGAMVDLVRQSALHRVTHELFAGTEIKGNLRGQIQLKVPIHQAQETRVQGSFALDGNDLRWAPEVPLLERLRGRVAFTESSVTLSGVQGRIYGGDARIEGGARPRPGGGIGPLALRVQGVLSADGLQRARELAELQPVLRRLRGTAAYTASVDVGGTAVAVPQWRVNSTLEGLAIDGPEPLGKPAALALPLRLENVLEDAAAQPPVQRLQFELGDRVAVTYLRTLEAASPRVLRGRIAVGLRPGESAPLPESGVLANIALARLDVGAWEALWTGAASGAGSARAGEATGVAAALPSWQDYLPTSMALRADELNVAGRRFDQVVAGGRREGPVWRLNVAARQFNGYLEYREPSAIGGARLHARLARLAIPREEAQQVENLMFEPQTAQTLPALDIVAEDFEFGPRRLGHLEIEAVNRGGTAQQPREWRLNRLQLSVPEATLKATGNWAAAAQAGADRSPRRTELDLDLDVRDAGALLTRFGMPDVVRRGSGKLQGKLAWNGSPYAPHPPSLDGALHIDIENGQFLKADPGAAKLLGVLSLQALPRRLTLDFRDVFSEGFAFDFVRGDVLVERGMARTNNLQMKGVNAAVLMDGWADIVHETQDLRVVVVPEINAGTASLVAAAINPAIGLGTVLAQLFVRQPLIKANTQEFRIVGSWSDPQVQRVNGAARPAAPASAAAPAASAASSPSSAAAMERQP
ncbi:YhdP family protein [Tibeticola sp.]|uniref:YhdP family protein n=1 Tax=Tibeticola sp. TaxID=2005368 RepID=UPI00259024CC|nr:YhdP family protein [Tibeticola sp.]MCI4439929.1 TIGR02099 family protein [Tibeticola sp.]